MKRDSETENEPDSETENELDSETEKDIESETEKNKIGKGSCIACNTNHKEFTVNWIYKLSPLKIL